MAVRLLSPIDDEVTEHKVHCKTNPFLFGEIANAVTDTDVDDDATCSSTSSDGDGDSSLDDSSSSSDDESTSGESSREDVDDSGCERYGHFNVTFASTGDSIINDDSSISSDSDCSYEICFQSAITHHVQGKFVERNGVEIVVNWANVDGKENVRLSRATDSIRRYMNCSFRRKPKRKIYLPCNFGLHTTRGRPSSDDTKIFKHRDSFSLYTKCSFRRQDKTELHPQQMNTSSDELTPYQKYQLAIKQMLDRKCETEEEVSTTDEDESSTESVFAWRDVKDKSNIPRETYNHLLAIAFTDHLCERLRDRRLSESDFYRSVLFGCMSADYNGRRFTYRGISAITDWKVKVGITIFEEYSTDCVKCDSGKDICKCGFCSGCCKSTNESNPKCPSCELRGKDICDRGFCHDCCYGCYTCEGPMCPSCKIRGRDICNRGFCHNCCYGCNICIGEECPICKAKAINLLCDLGVCPRCCKGCMTCKGEECPQCGVEGIGILCNRGFCSRCCWGGFNCSCP